MNPIQRVNEAIEEIRKGNMIIMLDDEDRENEGGLVYSATFSTAEKVNFMATHAKGLTCVAINNQTAKRLKLNPMVQSNTSSYETAFTASVDAADASTDISTKEKDDTIKLLASPISNNSQLVKPWHIFPLITKDGGVLVRTGHTEGSTAILFGKIKETTYIKFHTINSDINLFLNYDKLNLLIKSIDLLKRNSGVLIFLNQYIKSSFPEKNYGIGAQILKSLNIKGTKLLITTKMHSFTGLNGFGLKIEEEIEI